MFSSTLLQLFSSFKEKRHFCKSKNSDSTEIQDLILEIWLILIFLLAYWIFSVTEIQLHKVLWSFDKE